MILVANIFWTRKKNNFVVSLMLQEIDKVDKTIHILLITFENDTVDAI